MRLFAISDVHIDYPDNAHWIDQVSNEDYRDDVLILAGDLADPAAVVALLAASGTGPDGVVLEDDEGWPQYLAGRYRGAALAALVGALGDEPGGSVHRLMRPLDVWRVRAPEPTTRDLDTPEVAKLSGAIPPKMR